MLEDKDLLSIQEVRTKVEKAFAAWQKYRTYSQEQVDAIVERMAAAARANAKRLADLAVEETGYGNAKDKYIKNLLNCDWLPRRMRGIKTVGILRELPDEKIVEIGVPVGVVAAILPTTNPTSTAMSKTLVSLKAGNAIVISPHPRAFKCTCATAAILYQAALEAGAPEDIIQCVDRATMEGINALMRHERVSVILATGGHAMVKAAYSSGKPAFGVGPGNVPVLVDTSADLEDAVAKIVAGKSFDYGTVCSSEQALVAEYTLRDRILALLKQHKAYLCNDQQTDALGKLLITPNWTVNPQCVGQAPTKIAQMAGFEVPADTSIICCEIAGVGKKFPLSAEKLSPVLSLLFVADYATALDTCFGLLKFGGAGTHRRHLRQERYAHPRIRHAHAGHAGAGEHAGAAGLHRHHDQRIPLDDAGLRRHGRKQHLRQRGSAAPDQHQAAGLHRPHARRGVRNASGLRQGAEYGPTPAIARRRRHRSRGRSLRGGTLPGFARHRGVRAAPSTASAAAPSCGCSTPAPAAIRRAAIRGGERRRRSGGPLSGPPRHRAGRFAKRLAEIRRL